MPKDHTESINQEPEVFHKEESKALYKICFTISKAGSIPGYSILSFSILDQEPIISGNIIDYETCFTKDLLSKEALTWSAEIGLFKHQQPKTFLVNRDQEWRITEVFKSMIDERTETDINKSEMMKTLIYELILFTKRFLLINKV